MLIRSEQLVTFLNGGTPEEVIATLCGTLYDCDIVYSTAKAAMFANHQSFPCVMGDIGIVHLGRCDQGALCEDDGEIAIGVLKSPINWSNNQAVKVVFALALPSEKLVENYAKIARLSTHPDKIEALLSVELASDVMSLVNTKMPKIVKAEPTIEIAPPDGSISKKCTIVDPFGIHARPAAKIVEIAYSFESDISIEYKDEVVAADSIAGILSLEIVCGAEINIVAVGDDAQAAIDALFSAISGGVDGENITEMVPIELPSAPKLEPLDSSIYGVASSPGVGVAKAFVLSDNSITANNAPTANIDENAKLYEAIELGKSQINTLIKRMIAEDNKSAVQIFSAHIAILDDHELLSRAKNLIKEGNSAISAWGTVCKKEAEHLKHSTNPLFAARAGDYADLSNRIISILNGKTSISIDWPKERFIVVADDLTPSQTADLPRGLICGIITSEGSATAHTAILARSLSIPAVVAMGKEIFDKISDDDDLVIDGSLGFIDIAPSPERLLEAQNAHEKFLEFIVSLKTQSSALAITKDGKNVQICANISTLEDSGKAIEFGADGVGLLRTELLVQHLTEAPSEDYLVEELMNIALNFTSKDIIVRTYDIGGDKAVPFLHTEQEKNPFLGVRGIRLCFKHEEVFRTLLRAITIVSAELNSKISIMLPMISLPSEFIRAKEIYAEECTELGLPMLPLGMMVEVPSAVWLIDEFAKLADFFSIGSNDLTQYTFAMDRLNPMLADKIDALHPAVLKSVQATIKSVHAQNKRIGACGNLAGDPFGAKILVGLGLDELSMVSSCIPEVKAAISQSRMQDLEDMAQKALNCSSGKEIRELFEGKPKSESI